jgi:hypothetical protein
MVQNKLSLRAGDETVRWKPRVLLAIWVLGGALVSAGVGLVAMASPLSEASLQVTMYASVPSQAKVYFSDTFGNFSETDSQSAPIEVGVNNLSFPIHETSATSLLQRFDPCECGTALMIERITLETPLYFRDIPGPEWSPNASIGSLVPEAGSYFISGERVDSDPQLFLYADLTTFISQGQRVAFWSVFGATGLFFGITGYFFRVYQQRGANSQVRVTAPFLSTQKPGSTRKIPLGFVVFSALVATGSVGMMLFGAVQTGATIDEPAHVRHLTGFLSGGNYSSSAYGPVTAMLGHVANVAVGTETWGAPLQTSAAFEVRHLVTAGIGVLGLFSVAVAGWLMFGSIRWGIVSSALLGVIPLWVGHSMFNMKDIPVATGYTLVTTGLISLFATALTRSQRLLFGFSLVLVGSLLAVGTRPGSWPVVVLSLAAAGALKFTFYSSVPVLRRVRTFLLLVALVAGAGTAWALLTETGRVARAAVERSLSFPWSGFNLYNGERVTERPGLLGVNEVFLSYLPLLITVLVIFGSLYGLVQLWLTVSGRVSPTARQSGFVLVSIQAFTMVPVVVMFDPVLYDGARQLLFLFPALSLLGALGLFGLLEFLPQKGRASSVSAGVLLGAVALVMSFIMIDQARLFPYNYAYYNEIAQGAGVSGRWETDYWSASMKEAASDVAEEDLAVCVVTGNTYFSIQWLPEVCATLAPYVGAGAKAETSVLEQRQYWVVRTERDLAGWGPIFMGNCVLHDAVTRSLRGEEVTMSRSYVCEGY